MTTPLHAPASLAQWMSHQRWYANRGAHPQLEALGQFEFQTGTPGVRITTHLVLDHTVGKPALYQVPLTYRDTSLATDAFLVAEEGGRFVYDGPHDPAYTEALLAFILAEGTSTGETAWAHGVRAADGIGRDLHSRVLTGEQSNTSIVYEGEGLPVIVKVFRAIHNGENPDVVLQGALAAAGSPAVPLSVGHVTAEWPDRGEDSGRAIGHLAFAQEFIPGANDTWKVALHAAEHGLDFAREAWELGLATAQVHATLATVLPTSPMTAADIAVVIDQMHGRLASAIAEVPELERFAPAIRTVFENAAGATWPDQQRIHGDLHLGQVLSVPGRGWVMVDFEGEPLRPMRERSRLDSPMRDIAGMLRSFDYVAGSLEVTGCPVSTTEWVAAARAAFRDGYTQGSGWDIRSSRSLSDAFEIDKALYETVYEVRNRPTWLQIPVRAIERLSARGVRN